MPVIALCIALAFYAASSALGVWYVRTGSEKAPTVARRLAALGFAAHTLFLVWWAMRHGRLPAYATFEALTALLWCAVLAYLTLDHSLRARALTAFVMPLVAAGGLAILVFVRPDASTSTTARGWWLPVHVASSLLGAADFLVAAAAAVMYLVQQRQLKRRSIGPLLERLPSLDALDRLNYRAVALGMPIFTLALLSGVVLAASKGPGWWANWMIAASLLAWLVYAVLLHVRLRGELRGPKVAYLTVLGFLLVLTIVCAIAFLGDPLHTLSRRAAPGQRPPAAEVDGDAP